ncbi:MAG: OmpA family protein [Moraxellaceae bacterium]|nr:OmpA family protein [Moraxellaceae bacterium]
MKRLILPALISSTLVLTACCECEVPQSKLANGEQSAKQNSVKGTALNKFAGVFSLPAFLEIEKGKKVGQGTLNYYTGDKIESLDGNLYHYEYHGDGIRDGHDKFDQAEFDKSVDEYMKSMGAKEFYNDVLPADIDKELTALDGFQYHDYLSDNVDLSKTKVRQYVVEVGDDKTIYQVVSDAEHGEVGVFTTGKEKPFAGATLNESVEPEEKGVQDVIMEEVETTEAETTDANADEANADAKANDKAETDAKAEEEPKAEEKVTTDSMQKQLDSADKITLNINFDVAKASIRKDNQYIVDQIYKLMHDDKNVRFVIQGHTDSSGEATMNKRLSLARAKEVKAELEKKGIDSNRLKAEGFGEEKPLVDNGSKENRAKNRRVELVKF